ncbi:MAG: hypothetical protein CBC48_15895 [bacterium TMED88]|nr:hypothetical protein [Deltaproteobacteria bacterium]OUV25865.1 MAG: hypothetical protein CBC48_15895 [bacterium TMED88]
MSKPGKPEEAFAPPLAAIVTTVVSVLALGFLVWLVYFHEVDTSSSAGEGLPALNAFFNASAVVLLLAGRRAIRRGQRAQHQKWMLSALLASALFLVSYVAYHALQGDTLFSGTGLIRPIYFFILISHIALSAVVFPAILWTLYLALTDRIDRHRRLARWTWAGWMYVSVTGIVVFLMLHVIDWG